MHQFKVVDISELNLSYFDYDHGNIDDDFIPTIEKILEYRTIGFVSPVYWHTISAQMKTFIDRISDLLSKRKDLGRALARKRTFLLASGSTDDELPQGMEDTIKLTSDYMDMEYLGSFYAKVVGEREYDQDTLERAESFLNKLIEI